MQDFIFSLIKHPLTLFPSFYSKVRKDYIQHKAATIVSLISMYLFISIASYWGLFIYFEITKQSAEVIIDNIPAK